MKTRLLVIDCLLFISVVFIAPLGGHPKPANDYQLKTGQR